MNTPTSIPLRAREADRRVGRSRAQRYRDQSAGLLIRYFKLGARDTGAFEHEIDAIVAARARGATDDELRALVAQLHAARQATPTITDADDGVVEPRPLTMVSWYIGLLDHRGMPLQRLSPYFDSIEEARKAFQGIRRSGAHLCVEHLTRSVVEAK